MRTYRSANSTKLPWNKILSVNMDIGIAIGRESEEEQIGNPSGEMPISKQVHRV